MAQEDGRLIKITSAHEAQKRFNHMSRRAENRGMVVNDAKTGLICVSASLSFEAKTITTGRNGERIQSPDSPVSRLLPGC